MKLVFFDRDGTLIRDPEDLRVKSEDDIMLFDDSVSALRLLAEDGYSAVMITNQAGVVEGLITAADFERINNEVIRRLEVSGIKFLKTYACLHGADNACECRKPKPLMLLEALKEFEQKACDIFMVGDRLSDIEAGIAAGCGTILVKTGNVPVEAPSADYTATDLSAAVHYILDKGSAN
jgi:D-glycero-D-manno-heptose 1,7-bisphosphate phosphatase